MIISSLKQGFILLIVVTTLLSSCREEEPLQDKQHISSDMDIQHDDDPFHAGLKHYKFRILGASIFGLMNYIKEPAIRICISGASQATLPKWTNWITDSIQKWLRPLRQLTTDPIANEVAIVTNNQNCHASFQIVPGKWGYATISNRPVITVGPNVPYGVVFHEFGHTFGLGDTYQNGRSGYCQAGQPQSVMCNISFTDLQPDDIAGLKNVFARRFPNDRPPPPEPVDPKPNTPEPKDPEEPEPSMPEEPNNPEIPQEDYPHMALEYVENQDRYWFHFSLHESLDLANLHYCVGTEESCHSDNALWLSTKLTQRKNDHIFFRSYEGHHLKDDLRIVIKWQTGDDTHLKMFTITQ